MKNRIKELRLKQGMSQTQLGEAIGAHFTTIEKLENGKQRLSLEYMYPIADALKCHPRDLIPGPDVDYYEPLVPVVGDIERDRWTPPPERGDDDQDKIPVARHQAYRSVPHFAFRMTRQTPGDEPNVETYLICVPFEEARAEDLERADAVVERRHKHLVATEVRRIRDGALDPPADDIDSEDEIKGIVVVTVEPLRTAADS